MSPPRSPLHLIGVLLLLGALIGYLTVVVFAGDARPALDYPTEVGRELAAPMTPTAPEPVAVEASARVTIDLQPFARLDVPAERPRVRVFVPDPDAGTDARNVEQPAFTTEFVSGAASLPARVRRGRHLLRIRAPIEGAADVYRLVDLDGTGAQNGAQNGAHAGSDDSVDVVLGPLIALNGVVVDERGAPVADARVWCGGAEGRTDAVGRFAFPAVTGGDGVPLAVLAHGFATHGRRLRLDGATGELRIVLEPAARLIVQHAAVQTDDEPARAFVLPADERGSVSTAALAYPFWWQALSGGAVVGAGGEAQFDGLPIDVPLRVVVHHPRSPAVAAVDVVTKREPLRVTVQGVDAPALEGRVADETGAPLPFALVVDGDPIVTIEGDRHALPATACLLGRSHAFTDADGRFAVARTKSGRGRVAVQASGRFTLVADAVGKDGRLPRTLVLPELRAVEGEPAVGVTLADPGAHPLVRVARHGATLRDFAGHPGETVVHVPLRERAMMDVVVTSHRSDGSAPTVRRFADIAVVDGVMLPTR